MFRQLSAGQLNYNDNENSINSVVPNSHAEDSEESSSEGESFQEASPLIKQESMQDSAMVHDNPIEIGTETNTEEFLDKYIILHCAKLELSLIDASSGKYLANFTEPQINSMLNRDGVNMKTFIR